MPEGWVIPGNFGLPVSLYTGAKFRPKFLDSEAPVVADFVTVVHPDHCSWRRLAEQLVPRTFRWEFLSYHMWRSVARRVVPDVSSHPNSSIFRVLTMYFFLFFNLKRNAVRSFETSKRLLPATQRSCPIRLETWVTPLWKTLILRSPLNICWYSRYTIDYFVLLLRFPPSYRSGGSDVV